MRYGLRGEDWVEKYAWLLYLILGLFAVLLVGKAAIALYQLAF